MKYKLLLFSISIGNKIIVRVMFGNFAQVERAAGASSTKFPNFTSNINPKLYEQHRMIICLLLSWQTYTSQVFNV